MQSFPFPFPPINIYHEAHEGREGIKKLISSSCFFVSPPDYRRASFVVKKAKKKPRHWQCLGLVDDSVSEENYMIKPPEERPHQARLRLVRLVVFRVVMFERLIMIY